jgi:hypothetical protein
MQILRNFIQAIATDRQLAKENYYPIPSITDDIQNE